MNKIEKEYAEEYALAFLRYINKATLYAELLNAVSRKSVIDPEHLYEYIIEVQGVVLHGGKNDK